MEFSPLEIGAGGAILLFVLGAIGVPIAYASALSGTLGLVTILGWDAGLRTAGTIPHAKGVSYTLSVLPMFILLGYLAHFAGITQSAFEACRRWFGRLPGGLAIATIFAVAGFGAISGSSTAAAAVFSKVAIPEMLKERYSKALAAGSVAAGSVLDSLIPPSTIMVVYAIITDQSIGKLLVAGFVPGIFSAIVYGITITVMAVRNPSIAPPTRSFSWAERFSSLPGMLPIVATIVMVFTAMFYGWATPTEAGALAAFFMFVLALFNGTKFPEFKSAFFETASLTVVIFFIIWSIMIFTTFLGFANLPVVITRWVADLNMPPIVILLVIYAVFLVLGMFIDSIGIMVLALPIVFPVIVSLGYDPIWFGIIVTKLCGIGLLSPPFGMLCFVVSSVRPDIPLATVFHGIFPFIWADILVVAVLTAYPGLVTFILELGGA